MFTVSETLGERSKTQPQISTMSMGFTVVEFLWKNWEVKYNSKNNTFRINIYENEIINNFRH